MKNNQSKHKSISRISDKGLTFIELLLATVMLSVLSLALYGMLSNGIAIWQKVNQETPQIDINLFAKKLEIELRNCVYFKKIPFLGQENTLSFPALVNVPVLENGFSSGFYSENGKKITLNFALGKDNILDPQRLLNHFDPALFLIKITPVNPTFKAQLNNIDSLIVRGEKEYAVVNALKAKGYNVILSIGEWEENQIGSNCGQYIKAMDESCHVPEGSYSVKLEDV